MSINIENITEDLEWQRLKTLAADKTRWFELGQELYKIEKAARRSGSFAAIAEALGYQGRTAYHLARVAKTLDRFELTPPPSIGWRKLADVIGLLDADNYEEIFTICSESTREELAVFMLQRLREKLSF
jgi:hypothetical protein